MEFERKILRFMIVLLCLCAAAAMPLPSVQTIELGSRIGSFTPMPAISGSQSLPISGKAVIFFFWSFKCPVCLAYNDRMNELQDKYGDKGVAVFGVASSANETQEEIRANLANLKLRVAILSDSEGRLAELLGVTHTPSVFVFDADKTLRYRGAFDNNKKPGEIGRVAYVEDAVNAILSGRPVSIPETRSFGCSLKRQGAGY